MDLSQQEWAKNQKAVSDSVLLDVRTAEEFAEGHLPDAELLDIRNPEEFMKGLEELEATKTYFVYCRSGARSVQACHILKQQGIADCYNLLGGIMEWQGEITN